MSYLHDVATRLVAADTVSRHSAVAALEELAGELEGFGFRVALQRYAGRFAPQANLVAVAGPPVVEGLVLSGHVDVVPFVEQPGWTRDPLRLELGDSRVYGRGTSDMKGFLAQCMDAARRLDPGTLERPLVLLFTAEEEIGCRGAGALVDALPGLLGEVPVPRVAWIGEPTSDRVFHAHKGVAHFSVEVRGVGGHSSVPEAGVNAIAAAGAVIEALGALQRELRAAPREDLRPLFPEAPFATLNLGTVSGGTALNMIAERCVLDVSYRPLPDEDPADLHARVCRRLEALEARDPASPGRRAEVRVGPLEAAPGLWARRGTPLEATLREILDQKEEGGAPFCTDGGHFARAGIDALVCGPGDLGEAHQPDESLDRAAFERGSGRILRVVQRLCGGRPRGPEPSA